MDIKDLLVKYGMKLEEDKATAFDEEFRKIFKHKSEIATAQATAEQLKEQLTAANQQIEEFKSLDVDGIKKAADEWKAKAEKAEQDAKDSITAMKRDYAVDNALNTAKAKNLKAVKALLNMDAVTLTDAGLVGLDEQLKTVKAENAYLFDSDEATPRVVAATPGVKDVKDGHSAANEAFRSIVKGEKT